jgi:predicted dehydrogenase
MRILILGYSNIVRRRVIPALLSLVAVSRIEIASVSSAAQVELPEPRRGNVYDNYDQALSRSSADVVYISTLNIHHANLAEKALLKGFHVIVDKPVVTSSADAKRLVELAKRQKRCLAESTVYAFHPQISLIQDAFIAAGTKPSRITAVFSFPPRAANDYRYDKKLGGGAFFDLGPYAITPGRLFFKAEPEQLICRVNGFSGQDKTEISFSLLAVYSGGRSMVGHFGFDTEYRNLLNVFGPGLSVECERVFSITPEIENLLLIRAKNDQRVIKAPKSDCFVVFLNKVFADINNGMLDNYYSDLISDAQVLEKLRQAAEAVAI